MKYVIHSLAHGIYTVSVWWDGEVFVLDISKAKRFDSRADAEVELPKAMADRYDIVDILQSPE